MGRLAVPAWRQMVGESLPMQHMDDDVTKPIRVDARVEALNQAKARDEN